jgi:protein SCO1/2
MNDQSPMKPNQMLHKILTTMLAGLILFLMFMYGWQALGKAKHKPVESLPVYHSVTPFELTERSGRVVTMADLRGKISVFDFIFTRCPGPCLTLTTRMYELQNIVKKAPVQLVSISIDPYDTPEVLTKYAKKADAWGDRWWFLTGPEQAIHALSKNVFLLPVEKNPKEVVEKEGEYLHSGKLILVDAQGVIRGYYDGLDPTVVPRISADIGRLIKEAGL